jgi:O-antigen/teichoic acid export membrane protein
MGGQLVERGLAATAELLAEVPAYQRRRIVSGMRWTVWLMALAVPFSYGTSLVLARISPQAIGTYGLLTVYIGLVTALFYLGGDTVVIKFVPELDAEQRVPFLASYFLVICLALTPWLVVVRLWPGSLHYLFGESGGARFQTGVLCLSPIYIFFSLWTAALKGMLEIRWAQALMRTLTIASFLFYALLFFGARRILAEHYTGLIWGIYLGLTALISMVAWWHVLRLNRCRGRWPGLRFFLPRGFWSYTFSTQQLGLVTFFIQRSDYLLMLNFGGLNALGQYVAISTIAMSIPLINNLFRDTLLPSLTNLIASRDLDAASEVLAVHIRILFLADAAATCGLILLAGPVTALLGPKYASLRSLVVLMVVLVGLSSPGAIGSAVLASVGKQQRAVWVGFGQLVLFAALFGSLWPRWHLLGAVLASGLSLLLSNILLLVVTKHSVTIRFSAGWDYVKF